MALEDKNPKFYLGGKENNLFPLKKFSYLAFTMWDLLYKAHVAFGPLKNLKFQLFLCSFLP